MLRVKKQIGITPKLLTPILNHLNTEPPVGVAVLDTGISPHPDFHNRILAFHDFVNHHSFLYDDGGHGTHVAGCIGGSGKMSRGMYSGMHPGCRLVVGKVLNRKGEGNIEDMLEGLDWVFDHQKEWNIRIINISVGMGAQNKSRQMSELIEKIDEAWKRGFVVVCAAGNDGPEPMSLSLLGAGKQVISVGCHEGGFFGKSESLCENHSGRGPSIYAIRKPDIVAPGTRIVSCNAQFRKTPYIAKSGTSMATPIVSGALALFLQKYPHLTNEDAKRKLLYSAKDLGESWNKQGWGMLQMEKLLM